MNNKKQQIIDYATDLFMTQGYLATSTRQIAKGLGITQPAIYHHFKNKEDIYVNVLSDFTYEIGKNLRVLLSEDKPAEEVLANMSNYLIDNHSMNFSLMMKDMNEELPKDVKQQIFLLWNANYFEPFELFFEKHSHSLSKELNIDNLSLHFLRVLSVYMDKNINQKNDLPIEELIHIFFYGIMKKE